MIATNEEEGKLEAKPLWCDDCGDTYDREHRELVKDSDGRIRCHRPWLYCTACRDSFRPSAPVADEENAWEIHACAPCKHCGAPKAHRLAPCSCPEGLKDAARDKVDQDARNEAIAKAQQEAAAQSKLDRAIFEKEREEKQRPEMERIEKDFKETVAASRKVAQRDQLEAELRDREQALKGRALSRRESHQDAYDAAAEGVQVEDAGEPLEVFVGKMAEADDAPPSALLRRSDGEILFYDGKINWVFGEPGSGKSWLALYVVQESILRGQRTVFWDFEMSPGQTKARCLALGLDLVEAEREGSFLYLKPFAEESPLAMSQLKEWQKGSDGQALVVIDAAASSGAPSDGGDVEPWLKRFVKPFDDDDHTILVIDHVPKQKIHRADGPIGSARKLQAVTGAALDLSGIAWTQKKDGVVKLTVHKDRYGGLPAARRQPVARVYGRHVDGTLTLSIEPPEVEDNPVEAFGPMLRVLAEHPDGVVGQAAMRELVIGRIQKKDSLIAEALTEGLILKDKPGKKVRYRISESGQEFLGDDDV